MSGQQGNTPSPATRPEKKRILRSPFAHEIYLVLLVKLLLILAIKFTFFSHPLSQDEIAGRMDHLFAPDDSSPPVPSLMPKRTGHD